MKACFPRVKVFRGWLFCCGLVLVTGCQGCQDHQPTDKTVSEMAAPDDSGQQKEADLTKEKISAQEKVAE